MLQKSAIDEPVATGQGQGLLLIQQLLAPLVSGLELLFVVRPDHDLELVDEEEHDWAHQDARGQDEEPDLETIWCPKRLKNEAGEILPLDELTCLLKGAIKASALDTCLGDLMRMVKVSTPK